MTSAQDQNHGARGKAPLTFCVYGTYQASEDYPNTRYFLQLLNTSVRFRLLDEWGGQLSAGRYYDRTRSWPAKLLAFAGLGFNSLRAALRIRRACLRLAPDFIYVPYPGVVVLWCLSFLPFQRKATILVVDSFISLFDTVVIDRKLLGQDSLAARLLLRFERRALQVADRVLTDTRLNADYYAHLLGLDADLFKPLPLSINAGGYCQVREQAMAHQGIKVLFAGSFVPLQGVEIIVRAAALLKARTDLEFRLVGDGQTANAIQALISELELTNVSWSRGWMNSADMLEEYRQADLCLGIFGGTDKAHRVWPYKNYQAMAAGKALVSMQTKALDFVTPETGYFCPIPPENPQRLAAAIISLADDMQARRRLGQTAGLAFDTLLASEPTELRFHALVR